MSLKVLKSITALLLSVLLFFGTTSLPMFEAYAVDEQVIIGEQNTDSNDEVKLSNHYLKVSNGSSSAYLQSGKRELCIKIYTEDENERKDIGFLVQDSGNKLNYYFDRETVETIQSLKASTKIRYKVIDVEFRGEGTIYTNAFFNDEVGEFTVTTQSVVYDGYFEAYNQKTYDGKEHTAVNILSNKEGYANAFEDVTVEYAVTQDEGNSDNLSYRTDIPKITDAGNYTVYVKLTKGYSSTTITLNADILKNKEYAKFTESEINAVLGDRVSNPVKSLDDNLISDDKLTVNYDISTDYIAYATVDMFGNLTLLKSTDDCIDGVPVTATVSVIGNSNFEELELKYFLKITKSKIQKDSLSWYVNGTKVDTDAVVADYSSDLEYKCELKLNEESFPKGDVTYSIETDDVPFLEVDSDTGVFTVKVNSAGSFKLESKLNENKYTCEEIPSLSFTINKIDRSETIRFKEKSNLAGNDFKVGFGTDLDVSLENISSDVEYNVSVIEGEDFASIEKDADTGIWTLKPKDIGNVKIMATIPGNGIYNEKTIGMDIEIVKGDHELKVTYSEQVVTDNSKLDCNIGQADKGMIFSLASDDTETDYDVIVAENSIIKDSQVENGKLTISFNEKVTGTAQVTVKKDETEHYNAASITFTVSLDFGILTSIEEPCYTVEGVKQDKNNGWYTGKVNIKPKNQDFMINLSSFISSDFDEKFISNWEICTDGEYSFSELYYKDKDGNIYKEKNVSQDLPLNVKLDTTAPTIESITIEDINIDEESYYSNSDTNTLKITVKDETSGVASVLYKLSKDGEYTQVDAKQLTQNADGSVTATVTLTCETEKTIINGSLYVKVRDNAGLEINNEQKETKVVVIDRKAPTLKKSSQNISNNLQKLSCDIVFEDASPFESDNQKYVQEFFLKTPDGGVVNVVPTITTTKDGELCVSFEIDKPGVYIPIIKLQDNCENMTEWNDENSPVKLELLDKPETPQFKLSNASTDTDTFNKEESLSSAVLSFTAQHVNYNNFDIQCSVKDYEDSDIDANKILENAIRDFLRDSDNWHNTDNYYSIDIASCLKNRNGKVDLAIMYKNNIYSNGGGEDLFNINKRFTIDTIAPTDLSYKVEDELINSIMMTIFPFKIITKDNFSVVLSAKDNLNGGIDRFEYTTDGTTYQNAINEDGSWIVRFRGNINANFKFRVYDKANNVAYYGESDNIVVDNTPPVITINGNNGEINSDNSVFEDNVEITIHIEDEYPSGDEPTVKLERIISPLKQNYYRECSCDLKNEGDCVYSITIDDLAKYRLTVNYKDAAGNEAVTKIAEFNVISSSDKTESGDNLFDIVLSNDNLCKDTQYDGILYSKDVSANIVINDNHYFMPELLEVECAMSDTSGDVSNYNELTNTVTNSENWSIKNNKWSLNDGLIKFSDSAVYELKVKYNGKEKCSKKFTIDEVKPVLTDIKFSEGSHESIDGKSYVFYGAKEHPEISFCVEDLTSGIKTIECTFDDKYASTEIKTIPLNNTNKGSGQYTVAIPENYTGQVLITVYDYAGNVVNNVNSDAKIVDSEGRIMPELVTDSVVPNLKVSLGKENQEFKEFNGVKYFKSAVEMKATLVEKNFFQDSFSFVISKENGDKWEEYNLDSTLTATTDKMDTFSGSWVISDSGKYSYKVYYADKSGNESEIYEGIFVVDTTPPKLTITYKDIPEDTDTTDGLFSNESQTAIITVKDDNIFIDTDGTIKDASIWLETTKYSSISTDTKTKDDISNLRFTPKEDEKNTFTAVIELNADEDLNNHFVLSAQFTDLSGNTAAVDSSIMIDKERPTLTIDYSGLGESNSPNTQEVYYKKPGSNTGELEISITDANLQNENNKLTADVGYVEVQRVYYNNAADTMITEYNALPLTLFTNDSTMNNTFTYLYSFPLSKTNNGITYQNCIVTITAILTDKASNQVSIESEPVQLDNESPTISYSFRTNDVTDTEIALSSDSDVDFFKNNGDLIINITDANLLDLSSKDAISIKAALTYYNNSDSDSTQYVTTDCDINIDSVTFSKSKDKPNTYIGVYRIPMVYKNKAYKNCDVTLSTTVYDKAKNSASETQSMIIDMEAPTVTIQYDNEQCGNEPLCKEGENNHNHDVTATIQIVDANLDVELEESQGKYSLSESAFSVDVSAFDNGGARYTGISGLEFKESSNKSKLSLGENKIQLKLDHQESSHVYESKVTFSCNEEYVHDVYVNYALNISVSDLAGNPSDSFTKGDDTFTIDKESPNVEEINKVGGEGEDKGKKYYNTDQTLKFKIQEAFLDTDRCTLEIVKTDNEGTETADTATPNIIQEGDSYFVEKKFSEDADYKVTLKTTDYSGNTACLTRYFTIDKTSPEVKITFDNNSVQNSKYFNDKRKATITVTEHNFDTDNNILKITAQDNNKNPVGNYNSITKILEWSNDGDEYKAYVEFNDDANYVFAFSCKDQAGNSNSQIDFDESAGEFKIVNGQKQVVFTVDTKSPDGSVKVGDWLTDSALRNEYSYNQFSNEPQTVTLKAHDDLSGAILVEYITSSEIYNLSQLKAKSNWKKCDNNSIYSFEMTPNSRFIVYMHIVDNAGNEKFVSSNGVILDNIEPEVETLAPTISISPSISSNNGIFNTDVPFSVTVVDPYNNDVYSGLNNVSYEIINMGNVTESGVLYSTTTPMIQKYENDSAIVVNSLENNGNDITVRISAADFAGNMSSRDYNFAIDVTAPSIKLSYDNNNAQNSKYFKAARIATIEVTERNFVPDDFDLKLENAYGPIPSIESWTKVSEGTGNGDDTVWSATLEFSNDGDYSVGMSVTDEAGNGNSEFDYEGTSPLEFVIDRTAPKLTVVYDNNDASEGNYFADYRVATLTINERNFSSNDVSTHLSAKLNGADITAPGVSGWSGQGNVHTAEVKYNQDGDYQFNINYTDLAGNTIEEYAADEFHIDKTKAKITIKGVEDKTSYSGKVEPVITITDNNFSRKNTTITLTGAGRGSIKDIPALTTERKIDNGVEISFMNFEEKKEIDDIYTLIVSHRDLAGNETMSKLVFSVNRFGSTYEFSDATSSLNNKYVNKNKVNDIIISEVNVAELTSHTVTIYKDGIAIVLQQGRDYNIERISGEKWYKYVYTIFASNFTEDGIYSIKISSVDSAGNVADNTLDTKVKNLTFAVDNTPPEVFVTNVISGETYPVASLNAIISASDNIQVASLEVYLDGEKVQGWNEEQIKESLLNSEDLSYEILGNSTSPHNMKLICYDKADNSTEIELEKFYVTTNILIRLLTNKLLVFCILTIIAAMLLLTTVVVLKKRKRR